MNMLVKQVELLSGEWFLWCTHLVEQIPFLSREWLNVLRSKVWILTSALILSFPSKGLQAVPYYSTFASRLKSSWLMIIHVMSHQTHCFYSRS